MHTHLIDDLAGRGQRPPVSHGMLLAAQVLRMHEHRELPVSALNYREAAGAICEELRECSTAWLLQMRLRLPAVVQSLVEDELEVRRGGSDSRLSLASSLMQVPAYDDAWRRQVAAAAWRPVEARLRVPPA